MKIFVPWSEDLAENHPDLLTALVPYQVGMRCAHLAHTKEPAPAGSDRQGETDRDRQPPHKDAA